MFQIAMDAAGEGFRAGNHDLRIFSLFGRGLRERHLRRGKLVEQTSRTPTRGEIMERIRSHLATVTRTMAATPMTSARSRRTAKDLILPSTSRLRICRRRSLSSLAFSVPRPPTLGPGASPARVSALPPQATARHAEGRGRFGRALCRTGQNVQPYVIGRIFMNGALDMESLHQPDSPEWQADASLQDSSA